MNHLLALRLVLIPFNLPRSAQTGAIFLVQDEARQIVTRLASPDLWGRGTTRNGMARAAEYLVGEFSRIGLQPLNGESYVQSFEYDVNTFPAAMQVELNGRRLQPGVDFIVEPSSSGIEIESALQPGADGTFSSPDGMFTVEFKNKLTWSVGRVERIKTKIFVDRARFQGEPTRVKAKIQNEFLEGFQASNVVGMVRGTEDPGALLVLTAHYDHLGGMGSEAYFPGANDNASGVALLLAMARHYSANPPPKSVVFILFAGEEAGLVGSRHFVDHPLIDLSRIQFLTNFDLAGTGDDGIMVVNGTEFTEKFRLLQNVNTEVGAFRQVGARGRAANSDHHWFTERGVPAFFIYTLGGIAAYHDVYDRAETLPLNKIDDYIRMMIRFNTEVMNLPSRSFAIRGPGESSSNGVLDLNSLMDHSH